MLDAVALRAARAGTQRIVITGASGWLGMATLELLEQALGEDFAGRVCCFGSAARELELRSGRRVNQLPLASLADLAPRPSWLLHFAFLTKDRAEAMTEADYVRANRAIGDLVLGALDAIGVEALFLASSGAAARADDTGASAAMRLYGRLKLDDEARFAAWAELRGRRLAIGRIFSITGPYINKHQAYALASFILDGLAGRAIAVQAPRAVIRSYVAIRELMSLVFAVLAEKAPGTLRFDSGGEPLELAEVAQAVADRFPGGHVNRAPITDPAADSYHGDNAAYAGLLARYGIVQVPLPVQLAETIAYLSAR